MKPEAGALQHEAEHAQHDETEHQNDQPVVGDERAADQLEPAGHPARVGDGFVRRAEDRADELLQDEADAPGRQQRLERPRIEETDDAALQGDAERAGHQKRHRQRRDEIDIEPTRREIADEYLLHDIRGVGTEHDHFAMRHVDDAHDAEGDGEADRGEQQDRAEGQAFEQRHADADELEPLRNRADRMLKIAGSVELASSAIAASWARLSDELRRAPASAKIMSCLISASVSLASAFCSAGTPAADGCLTRSSAAASRSARLPLNRLSAPSAASITPRTRLFTTIWSMSSDVAVPIFPPPSGSNIVKLSPSGSARTTFLSFAT